MTGPPRDWYERRLHAAGVGIAEIGYALDGPCEGAPELPKEVLRPGGVIAGGIGSGKTVLAVRILVSLLRAHVRDIHDGDELYPPGSWGCRYIVRLATYDGLQHAIRERSRGNSERWRALLSPATLVLDDLGRAMAPWMAEAFEALVSERVSSRRVTLVTTNLPCGPRSHGREDAFETLYPRAASRLLDARGLGLILTGKLDLRR